MGKKRKGNDRRERKRRDDRVADITLRKWLHAQESAALLCQDLERGPATESEVPHIQGAASAESVDMKMAGSSLVVSSDQDDAWVARKVAGAIGKANIFILSPEQYGAYYHEADVYTTETVAEMPWSGVPVGGREEAIDEDEAMEHFRRVQAAGRDVPVPDPDRWPFPCMWISFGEGVRLAPLQVVARLQAQTMAALSITAAVLVGQLWVQTERGPFIVDAIQFEHQEEDNEEAILGMCWASAYHQGWKHPYDLNPWICNAIHRHLLDFKTFVVEKNWRPHQVAKTQGPTMVVRPPMPKPYYVVKLQSKVIQQDFRRTVPRQSRRFDYSHRFPVRGHYRVRIRRGPMPLPERDKAILDARKYVIYTLGLPSAEHAQLLASRGISPKRPGEWLAILVTWVKDHERGPDSAPFVPSIRVA